MSKNKKITVFGGSGAAGLLLIEKALSKGYAVTAFVRTPSKIPIRHDNLTIMQGNLTDVQKIEEAVTGSEAIISILGPVPKSKGLVVANGMKNIIAAAKKSGVKRLIATVTPSFADSNDKFQFSFAFAVFMIKKLVKESYYDIVQTGKYVSESGLDWTLVRLPMLSTKPETGEVHAGYVGDGRLNLFSLTRADLANFLLEQIGSKKWNGKAPAISN
ncbi:NAD(P)-dependent oxidoreductase [Mucilaginibacter sp. FT3.2]|uniref:NAD(P)-dependent oxidoreductase n=1 Tax=Mucilaginibacter sp. FT3.2 TaxID=2723090 RepID=UPI00160E4C7B|nr:NAD(P)H-binding protein [Mucilaginibacter sp. FT3.2]MBB6232495.1 nucleoside-diphosphate-sugar epimerase [Mucilaginibacter sp. FT3.2]